MIETASVGGRPASGEPLIDRALRVLESFREPGEFLTLTQLANRSQLSKATTHRIVDRLAHWGAIERAEDGQYSVGLRLLEIASLAPRGHVLRATALPFMEDLLRATGQHVLLAVLDGTEAVLVERLSAHQAGDVQYRIGGRLPLDRTGVGVVLLAESSAVLQTQVVDGTGAARGPVEAARLRQQLARVRSDHFVILRSQEPEQLTSVAAPVRDGRNQVIAAISVVIPNDSRRARAMLPAVVAIARAISREMGQTRDGQR